MVRFTVAAEAMFAPVTQSIAPRSVTAEVVNNCWYLSESPFADPVASPVSLNEDIGMFAVIVCVPSFSTQVVKAVTKSANVEVAAVEEIVVPVTGTAKLLEGKV